MEIKVDADRVLIESPNQIRVIVNPGIETLGEALCKELIKFIINQRGYVLDDSSYITHKANYNKSTDFTVFLKNPAHDPLYPKPFFDSEAKQKVLLAFPRAWSYILANNQLGPCIIYDYYGGPVTLTTKPSEYDAWNDIAERIDEIKKDRAIYHLNYGHEN